MNSNRTIAVATGVPGMSSDRKAAVWIGVLYIIGTVAFESMAAWLPGVIRSEWAPAGGESSRAGAWTMRPLHHQVGLNLPELSFRVGVAPSGGDPLGDAPEHPGESPVQGAGPDPVPSFARLIVRARV